MRYFVKLAYNGSNYHGWQIQPNAISVQEVLTKALNTILNKREISVIGAGRTDTGVHARIFYAHFEIENQIINPKDLIYKLNRFLPNDIAIYDIFKVIDTAHTRFDALNRTYKYYISTIKNPFYSDSSFYLYAQLDVNAMNFAANPLLGEHDFTSFSKLHTQTNTNLCNLMEAKWSYEGDILVFKVKADRFLRNMVRALVGTFIDIGRGKITPEEILDILTAKDRRIAGESVPAKGLFLEDIEYDFIKLIG